MSRSVPRQQVPHWTVRARLAGLVVATVAILGVALAGPAAATTPKPQLQTVPGASTTAFGVIKVFYRSTADRLIHRNGTATVWGGVEDLGGVLASGPAAITIGSEFAGTWAFVQGTTGEIWYRVYSDGRGEWGPWQRAGGRALGAPGTSCVGDFTALPIVYVRGGDDALWRRTLDGPWRRIGGGLASDPGAVPAIGGACPSREDVFVLGGDSQVWEWAGGTAFRRVGGSSEFAPAAVEHPSGRTDLFVRGLGLEGALWMNSRASRTSAWSGWHRVGGRLTSAPVATLFPTSPPTRAVFALGTDGDLWWGRNVVGTTTWTWREVP
jgi:hypothetical protein